MFASNRARQALQRTAVAALLIVLGALAACGSSEEEAAAPVLPSFPLGTVDGEVLDIADFNDQDTLFWFWAPW